jgi:hypothetical protein
MTMNRHHDNPLRTFITCVLLFFVGYALEIAADVWVVNHPAPNDPFARYMPVPVTHIRHYVLRSGPSHGRSPPLPSFRQPLGCNAGYSAFSCPRNLTRIG